MLKMILVSWLMAVYHGNWKRVVEEEMMLGMGMEDR